MFILRSNSKCDLFGGMIMPHSISNDMGRRPFIIPFGFLLIFGLALGMRSHAAGFDPKIFEVFVDSNMGTDGKPVYTHRTSWRVDDYGALPASSGRGSGSRQEGQGRGRVTLNSATHGRFGSNDEQRRVMRGCLAQIIAH